MKLYHLTPVENAQSILKNGLLINQEPYACLEPAKHIYLTTDIKALCTQEGEWGNDLAVFSIEWEGYMGIDLLVDWEVNYENHISPFAYYVNENIKAKNIKLEGILLNGKVVSI